VTGLRTMLASGRQMLGTFSIVPSIELIEMIGFAGFDFVIIDMEHGPYSINQVRAGLTAARAHDLMSIVRVPDCAPAMIGAVLDAGANGVLVPQVDSADGARAAVAAARFAPEGERGAHPWVSASGYGKVTDWFAVANRETAVMVMIEGKGGISAISEIIATPGLDAIFLGPVDLSHSLGVPGETGHPLVLEAMQAVAEKAAASGLATAVFAPDPERARSWWPYGIRLVACAVDSQLILGAFAHTAVAARP
jgi:4-hydroxy-2-oxoheptanedioate aldolase